jgi:diaminopimelate epimerase
MSTIIQFKKMHGLGNDFVVINAITQSIHLTSSQIRKISDRHFGIGCDQVLLVEESTDPDIDFFYRIYNSDGSEVGQCGNGARCLAKFIQEENLSTKNTLRVKTLTSILTLYIEENNIRVDMGVPKILPSLRATEGCAAIQSLDCFATLAMMKPVCLSIGNPHIVFTVSNIQDPSLSNLGLDNYNVGFMQILDKNNIKLRVFERGVGETKACGSGACAAAVAGIIQNNLSSPVTVELPGGKLHIKWQGENHSVFMTGPAETVYVGWISAVGA